MAPVLSSWRVVKAMSGADEAARLPVKQLLRKLQYRLRRSAAARPEPVTFAYDPESYSQNFDDGHGSADQHHCYL